LLHSKPRQAMRIAETGEQHNDMGNQGQKGTKTARNS